jgi:hypothetical protein
VKVTGVCLFYKQLIYSHYFIADVASKWYEDLQSYESNLDEMASANLDQVIH